MQCDSLLTPTPVRTIVHRNHINRTAFSFVLPPTPLDLHQQLPSLHVLAQPPDTLAVSLPHHHTAHEHLDRPNALQRHLALARRLVQAEGAAQLVFRHGLGVIDLVSEDDEGRVLELFHGEQRVELGFGFVEALVVFGVDEEYDA
jgi:hypothetical protein